MTRHPSRTKIFETVAKIMKPRPKPQLDRSVDTQSGKGVQDTAQKKKAMRLITRSLKLAFKKAGLNIDDEKDWTRLTAWMAVALYGPKRPGRTMRWTNRQLLRLLKDVERTREQNPSPRLNETQCCELLIKELPYKDMMGKGYVHIDSTTLRRQLQNAKKLKSQVHVRKAAREASLSLSVKNSS